MWSERIFNPCSGRIKIVTGIRVRGFGGISFHSISSWTERERERKEKEKEKKKSRAG
jgi:hypothetical protein